MTPKISLISTVAGAVLVLAVPAAWGKGQPVGPSTASMMAEDGFDRAVAARIELDMVEDGFDRAVAAANERKTTTLLRSDSNLSNPRTVLRSDSVESAIASGKRSSVVNPRTVLRSDFVESAIAAGRPVATPSDGPIALPTSSVREIEWPQIGLGFGVGILLALGVGLAMRHSRIRPLAHG